MSCPIETGVVSMEGSGWWCKYGDMWNDFLEICVTRGGLKQTDQPHMILETSILGNDNNQQLQKPAPYTDEVI